MLWRCLAVAAAIGVIYVLDRMIMRRKKDHVSDKWLSSHHTDEGHQDHWLAGRDR